MFFILQPVFLVLLHALITHPRLIPFHVKSKKGSSLSRQAKSPVLRRRRTAAFLWIVTFLLGVLIVNEAHGHQPRVVVHEAAQGMHSFYLGWILVWMSPVIAFLTWIGARLTIHDWVAWAIGSTYLCIVDT